MADADEPRPSEAIPDDARVAASGDDGMLHAQRLQNADAAIYRVTLCDAAEVDAHACALEAHGMRRLIELQMAPVHAGQGVADLLFRRLHVAAVVVEIADA